MWVYTDRLTHNRQHYSYWVSRFNKALKHKNKWKWKEGWFEDDIETQRSVTVSGQCKLWYKAVTYRNGKKWTGERWVGTVLCTTVCSNSTTRGVSEGVCSICHAVHHPFTLCHARVKHFTSTSTLTQKLYFKSHKMGFFNSFFFNHEVFLIS